MYSLFEYPTGIFTDQNDCIYSEKELNTIFPQNQISLLLKLIRLNYEMLIVNFLLLMSML